MTEFFSSDEIIGLKSADESTIRTFVQKFTPLALRISLRYTRNHDDAADIAQMALVKILQNLEKFRISSNADAWIYKIVANTSIDFKRNIFRKRRISLSKIEDPGVKFESPFETETVQQILKFTMKLPSKMRMIFILYYQEEMKSAEIAEILDISVNTVRVQLLRARRSIRENMKLSSE